MPTPEVIGIVFLPTGDQNNVALNPIIQVNFNTDLLISNVNTNSVRLVDQTGNPISISVRYVPLTRTIEIRPQTLQSYTQYTVTIYGDDLATGGIIEGITDILGNPMIDNFTFTFTTGTEVGFEESTGSSGSSIPLETSESVESFTVLISSPADGDYNISSNSIIIKFNKTIDQTSISSNNVFLYTLDNSNGSIILTEEKKQELLLLPIDCTLVTVTLSIQDDILNISFQTESNKDYVLIVKDIKSTQGDILSEPYIIKFSSSYDPLYIGLSQISLDLGKIVEDINPDTILHIIRTNSSRAAQIAGQYLQSKLYEVSQYVRYQSEYEIVRTIYTSNTVDSISRYDLGEFSVTKDADILEAIASTMNKLKQEADYWLSKISSSAGRGMPKSFRKNIEYPSFMTRTW